MLKKIGFTYLFINKKMNHFRDKVIQNEIEKEKRKFFKRYLIDPTENEINEMKKSIILKKSLPILLLLIFSFMFIIIQFNV